MKSYPSIPAEYSADAEFFCFDKLDGSNIRVEWSSKKGFQRFGTRRLLIDQKSPFLPATVIIKEKFEEQLGNTLRKHGYQSATCFFEYFGPNSFAGTHSDNLNKMKAKLLDVNVLRIGMLPPERFLEEFGDLDIPNFLGVRKLTPELVDEVKSGTLNRMTFEGIIGKNFVKNKLRMVKVKNRNWVTRLREVCTSEEEFKKRV